MLAPEILEAFEKGLNPSHPEDSKVAARIVGYGEISAIFEVEADPGVVYKRLPLFTSRTAARKYQRMYRSYCDLLEEAGLILPSHASQVVTVPGHPVTLYIAQKKMPEANFGHTLIHRLNTGSGLDFIQQAFGEIAKVWVFNEARRPHIQLAIDGQLSNWVRAPDAPHRLYYIDTSTPLFCDHGVEQQDPELLLKSAPAFLRWVIRLFFLKDVMTRYYIPRLVFMDLIANLHKEQKPALIGPAIECANACLPDGQQPLSRSEVDSYYREDKWIWTVFLLLRRLDRLIATRLFRRRYEFILPGNIKR